MLIDQLRKEITTDSVSKFDWGREMGLTVKIPKGVIGIAMRRNDPYILRLITKFSNHLTANEMEEARDVLLQIADQLK